MKPLTTEETRNVILTATTLNARKQHKEAIALIRQSLNWIDQDLRYNALKEIFNAALALDDMVLVKLTAREIAKEDPDMPSIQEYL